MDNETEALRASLLPQYIDSDAMYHRFLKETLSESGTLKRDKKTDITASISADEAFRDSLSYFTDPTNKKKLSDEFYDKLNSSLVPSQASLFIDVINKFWTDGFSKRFESKEILGLMQGIEHNILEYRKVKNLDLLYVLKVFNDFSDRTFDDDEIQAILKINREMLDHHLAEWLTTRTNYEELSTESIHAKRGMYLKKRLVNPYYEMNYITSYSLSFSVSEQFAQMRDNHTPTIINTKYDNISHRVLFFTPFIPNLDTNQLEFGIIPHYNELNLVFQDKIGGVEEYMLD